MRLRLARRNEEYNESIGIFSNSQKDDLRFAVRAIKSGDGEQAIFSLCRALGDATEAADVIRNEWRLK